MSKKLKLYAREAASINYLEIGIDEMPGCCRLNVALYPQVELTLEKNDNGSNDDDWSWDVLRQTTFSGDCIDNGAIDRMKEETGITLRDAWFTLNYYLFDSLLGELDPNGSTFFCSDAFINTRKGKNNRIYHDISIYSLVHWMYLHTNVEIYEGPTVLSYHNGEDINGDERCVTSWTINTPHQKNISITNYVSVIGDW